MAQNVGSGDQENLQGPSADVRSRSRRANDLVLGWGGSLVLHVLVLICFFALRYSSGPAGPPTGGKEWTAGVVDVAKRGPIEAGRLAPMRLKARAGEVAVPKVEDAGPIEPIVDLGQEGRPASKIERIIGIDVSSGGGVPSGMKADWTSFAAGGVGTGGASFFGLEARGAKFVFVVDRSGSMTGAKLDAAKAELIRAVQGLRRAMKFYVIFFHRTHEPMPAKELVRATEAAKRKHLAWVRQISAAGDTDPTSAMMLALSLKPDVVWLLSDGIFDRAAADVIRNANADRRTQIHTIAFYSREGERVLRRIAQENHGRYRFVSPAALGLGGRRR